MIDATAARRSRLSRWTILSIVLLGAAGLLAIALPVAHHFDCPVDPSNGPPCLRVSNDHAMWRLIIVVTGTIPLLLLLHRLEPTVRRRAAWSLILASLAAAVILALPRGKVPFTRGDCPPYHECFTIGRPYLDLAVLVGLLGIVAARYLWPTQPATQTLHRVRI